MFSFRHAFAGLRTLALGTAAFAAATFASAAPARAGLTTVMPETDASEQGHADIMAHQYGGAFAALANGGYTNGTVTATRVDDAKDTVWYGGSVKVDSVASFARSNQTFGLTLNDGSGTAHDLFSTNAFGYAAAGSSAQISLGSSPWQFTLDNGATLMKTSSLAAANGSAWDQMVTYKVDGLADGRSTYLMFWEDSSLATGDRDYNDFVAQASFSGAGGPTAVPLPPAAWAGLTTMAGALAVTAWKKRKAQTA
ncbi:MAG: hypothetical protein JWO31_2157 [Phycisphaerales bacterium]|nr:hypothetical protein [Phycisphaerales bacterium]